MFFVKTQESGGCSSYVNLSQVTEVKVYRGGRHDGMVELHFTNGAARTLTGGAARSVVERLEACGAPAASDFKRTHASNGTRGGQSDERAHENSDRL